MIAIKGVKLDSLEIKRDVDSGEEKFTGAYSLMSTNDKVLAKQNFNTYSSDIKVAPSQETQKLLTNLMTSVKSDIQTALGLEEK